MFRDDACLATKTWNGNVNHKLVRAMKDRGRRHIAGDVADGGADRWVVCGVVMLGHGGDDKGVWI